jgi:hypothetical protein
MEFYKGMGGEQEVSEYTGEQKGNDNDSDDSNHRCNAAACKATTHVCLSIWPSFKSRLLL